MSSPEFPPAFERPSKEAGFDKHLTKPVAIKEVTEFLSSVGHMKVISSDK
jgi:hypothetical protein